MLTFTVDKSNDIPSIEVNGEIAIHYDNCDLDSNTHTHNYIEVVYVLEGKGTQYVNNIPYRVKRGDVLFINYGQLHMVARNKNLGPDEEPMRILDILIRPGFIDHELVESRNAEEMLALSLFESFADIEQLSPVVSFTGKDLVEMEYIVQRIRTEWKERDTNYKASIKGYVLVLLNKVFREMSKNQLIPVVQHVNHITPEIIEYIEEHYAEKINLTELAQMCFYNPCYFSKMFRETFGKSLTDFIQDKRVEKAIELLKDSDVSITDIVKQTGFCDKKQLYKVFKKVTGLTPGEYRGGLFKQKEENQDS